MTKTNAPFQLTPQAAEDLDAGCPTSRGFRDVGCVLRYALSTFNTYPLFEALGDAVITGPTGNNLRDLRILLAY